MADASLFISILALVLSFLTFLLKLWQDYASAERAKVLEEVLARDGYEQAQAAAFDIVAVTRRFEDPKYRITRDSVDPRCQQHLPRSHLDYADIYLLHGLGMLNGELIVVQINALEAARQKTARWWGIIAGKYKSCQLLHAHLPLTNALRWLLGLPIEPFFGKEWSGKGKRHLELVEPLDIASWYILPNNWEKDYCDVIEEIRPYRYILLQQQAKRVFNSPYDGHIMRTRAYKAIAEICRGDDCKV